jgi:hypothetical protein
VLLDRCTGRPFQVAVDVEPLEEAPGIPDATELLGTDEQVIAPIDLAGAPRAVGRRDREPDPGLASEQLPDNGALARTRGARDDDEDAQGTGPKCSSSFLR